MTEIPVCAGEYERCEVCDGNPKGIEADDIDPCAWRNRCVAFQAFLKDRKKQPSDYLHEFGEQYANAINGAPRFKRLCDAQIEKYGVVDGKVTKSGKPERLKNKPTRKARAMSVKTSKALAKKRRARLEALYQHFKMHLIENLVGYKFVPPKGIVVPGMLYAIDRKNTSGYIAVYCKEPGVIGVPVAQLILRPKTGTFDVALPIEYVGFSGIGQAIMRKIHPEPIIEGRFLSICRGMDEEGVALVAQTIARLIKAGKIELPKP